MNNKLIINFKQIENVVFAAPINIPDWAKGINISYPENTFKYSAFAPIIHHLEIEEVFLYIPPKFSNMMFTPRCKFDNAEQAENWINYMNDAIEKLNTKYAGDENMIMKNEKLAFDIGVVENIVIIKVIDIPTGFYSAGATEEFDMIDDEKATVYIEADVLKENRSMIFDYKYFDETGDNWKVIVPDSTKAVNIPMKALTFSSGFKATQFVKCFKAAVAKVNVQFTVPVPEKYMIEWERCE